METKMKAFIDHNKKIIVRAKFLENGKVVHRINHGFPYNSTPKEIRKEVEKAGELFLKEREQAKYQKKIDKDHENAKSVVNKLNKDQ